MHVVRQLQKKYDIPLYKRGKDYVLHRIVKVGPDSYVICGDNCLKREYGITDEQIIGVLSEVIRGERRIDLEGWPYRLYCRGSAFFKEAVRMKSAGLHLRKQCRY